MDETARWEFAFQIAKTHGAVPPDSSPTTSGAWSQAAQSHATMILNYPIASFDQAVHLVRPEQPDVLSHMTGQTLGPDLGWGDVVGRSAPPASIAGRPLQHDQRAGRAVGGLAEGLPRQASAGGLPMRAGP